MQPLAARRATYNKQKYAIYIQLVGFQMGLKLRFYYYDKFDYYGRSNNVQNCNKGAYKQNCNLNAITIARVIVGNHVSKVPYN